MAISRTLTEVPADFVAECADCRYDLTGLPDGRCPECGVIFTRAGLYRLHLARLAAKAEVPWKLLVSLAKFFGLFSWIFNSVEQPLGQVLMLGTWIVCVLSWMRTNRDRWIVRSHVLLIFLVPLMISTLMMVSAPYGWFWCVIYVGLGVWVSRLALKWSPLVSSGILIICFVLPLMAYSVLILMDGLKERVSGHYWSSFDYPTSHGWRAMPVDMSLSRWWWVMAAAALVVTVVVMYSKRALVRLRAMKKPVPGDPTTVAESVTQFFQDFSQKK